MKSSKKAKKRFFVLSVLFVGIVGFSFVTIFKDWMQVMSNKQQLSSLNNHYSDLLEEEERLTSEVTKLHDEDYIARYAREKYMYTLPGEFIIKIPNNSEK